MELAFNKLYRVNTGCFLHGALLGLEIGYSQRLLEMTPLHQLSNWLVNINNLQVCSWYSLTPQFLVKNEMLESQVHVWPAPQWVPTVHFLYNFQQYNPPSSSFSLFTLTWFLSCQTGEFTIPRLVRSANGIDLRKEGAARNLQQPQTPKTKEQQTGF